MKPSLPSRSLAAAVLLAASLLGAAPIPAAPATSPADRSARIRSQINELLGLRRTRTPLPVDPPNPFAAPVVGTVAATGGASREPAAAADRPAAPVDHAAVLARLTSRLRIGGLIRIKDQTQVVINDHPWREGDSFVVEREPRLIQLQVVRIVPGQVTLRLEDAELTLRF